MARNRTAIDEWELYVPGVDEGAERELYQERPNEAVTMELKFLTTRERNHFARVAARAEKGLKQRNRYERELKRLLVEHVRNIRNVTVDDVDPVTTGTDLWDSNEDDIKTDVAHALMDIGHLDAGLGKKLSSPSASLSSRQTGNAGGVARTATQQSSEDS